MFTASGDRYNKTLSVSQVSTFENMTVETRRGCVVWKQAALPALSCNRKPKTRLDSVTDHFWALCSTVFIISLAKKTFGIMFFRFVLLVVSLMSFLRGCCVSSCGEWTSFPSNYELDFISTCLLCSCWTESQSYKLRSTFCLFLYERVLLCFTYSDLYLYLKSHLIVVFIPLFGH